MEQEMEQKIATFSIGEAAAKVGTSVQLLRHYEAEGLIPPPPRSNGRRIYTVGIVERLMFIRHARSLGFSLAEVRTLLDLQDHPERDCHEADEIASAHLVKVEERLKALTALKEELTRMVGECRHDRAANCRVIEVLADHDLCEHDHVHEVSQTTFR